MTAVYRPAIDVLIRVCQRRADGIVAEPIVDSNYRAIVGIEAVGAEQRHRPALVADVRPGIEAARRREAGVESATQAEIGVRLEDDINDACHAFRIVLR